MGGPDEWIFVDGSDDIQALANRLCKHLEEDSFHDL